MTALIANTDTNWAVFLWFAAGTLALVCLVQWARRADAQVEANIATGLAEIDLDRWDHEVDEAEERCCPTPQAAARNLCYCWGGGSGQWIGSAS